MSRPRRAFVLGGGGKWGAVQIGMLRALLAAGRVPDLVLGCSIGAINGAAFAADPSLAGLDRLARSWTSGAASAALDEAPLGRAWALARMAPAIFDSSGLQRMIDDVIPVHTFEQLDVPFACVAASIERAAEHWFDQGDLTSALLASSAIPVLFPPVERDGEHFADGGLVNSIPVDRAAAAGAEEIYVLQVGRTETSLRPPRRLHESALVAFEIARRHRYVESMDSVPDGCVVHVLPSGNAIEFDDRRQLRWRDLSRTAEMIDGAERASRGYLASIDEVTP